MEAQNILNPKAQLLLPRFICYALINHTDRKFYVFGTESFLSHYADQIERIKKNSNMRRDALDGKFEVVVLETRQISSAWEYDNINDSLLVTKWYDNLIESGYKPYKEGGVVRVEIRVIKQEDATYGVFAKTVRKTYIPLANFPSKDEALEYKKRWYDGKANKVYKLIRNEDVS